MIKEYIRNYIIRSTIFGIFSLIGNNSQNSASDTIKNKFYNSIILEEINKNNLEKITKRNLLFYLENKLNKEYKNKEYKSWPDLNFYKPK